jgi:branched-chain amino acid transport system permease protein
MTGVGGTISLCQATFGAIGAFTTAQVVDRWDAPVLGAMLIGALVAAAVGAVLALPVIRLPAVYAALATLAFALMFETIVRPLDAVSGGQVPVSVPRPTIGTIDFANDSTFLVLVAVLAAVVAGGVTLLKRGTTGSFLSAINGSETAAASVGINPSRQRLVAFVVAAGIAGMSGGLIAMWAGQANYEANFVFFLGLVWLALAVTLGARSVGAAAVAGVAFYAVPKILNTVFSFPSNHLASNPDMDGFMRTVLEFPDPSWSQAVAFTLFGLGALTYARHPEGVVRYNSNRVVSTIRSLR